MTSWLAEASEEEEKDGSKNSSGRRKQKRKRGRRRQLWHGNDGGWPACLDLDLDLGIIKAPPRLQIPTRSPPPVLSHFWFCIGYPLFVCSPSLRFPSFKSLFPEHLKAFFIWVRSTEFNYSEGWDASRAHWVACDVGSHDARGSSKVTTCLGGRSCCAGGYCCTP